MCVLEYCSAVCLVVIMAAHAKLCGEELGRNITETFQAVIHCEHTCSYFFVLNAIIVFVEVIYPLT
jgi:hypothetical protein